MPMHDWTRVKSGIYHNFHYRWLASIMDFLNEGLLPPGYFAMAEQIIGGSEPDVVTLQSAEHFTSGGPVSAEARVGMAVKETPPQTSYVMLAEVDRYARKANQIVIKHELGDVVAVVEIVSPGNKSSRHALRSFVEKSAELLYAGINLLIVDPFPPGPRDPQGVHKAIWDEVTEQPFELPADRPLTVVAYQAAPIKTAYIEPIAVGIPLPDMPLFLHDKFYVYVPLEQTYIATWEVLPRELQTLLI